MLGAWDADVFAGWEELTERARKIARTAGEGETFERLLREVEALLRSGDSDGIRARLGSRRFVRALLTVWRNDPELAQQTLRSDLVDAIMSSGESAMSRLSALTLSTLLFRYFDELDGWEPELFTVTSRAVTKAAKMLSTSNRKDLVENIRRAPELFTSRKSPRRVAAQLVADEEPLASFMKRSGASGHDGWRFGALVRREMYLEQVRQANPSRAQPFLHELRQEELFKAPDGELFFGHAILRELASRPETIPHEEWIDTALAIGGDPRRTGSKNYSDWWAKLGDKTVKAVSSWLSAEDLRLFLHAIESIGEKEQNETLNRLFPGRKTFLWGLFNLGLVKETRLFAGSHVRGQLANYLSLGFRTDIAHVNDPGRRETSLLAIDCGTFSLVEGSHNVKLWMFAGRRDEKLYDRSIGQWNYIDVTEGSRERFARQRLPGFTRERSYGRDSVAITHRSGWERRALQFLADHRIPIDAREVLNQDTLRAMKRSRGGIPVPKRN